MQVGEVKFKITLAGTALPDDLPAEAFVRVPQGGRLDSVQPFSRSGMRGAALPQPLITGKRRGFVCGVPVLYAGHPGSLQERGINPVLAHGVPIRALVCEVVRAFSAGLSR